MTGNLAFFCCWQILFLHSLTINYEVLGSDSSSSYIAAVYDHAVQQSTKQITKRSEALEIMFSNLEVLEKEASNAKTLGADIFVFPEYGITGRLTTRNETYLFLETVPNPGETIFCPCDSNDTLGQEVLHRLSCIARYQSMYIAANFGDKQPCANYNDLNCPTDGILQYNTEVVFNRQGCLVARYHKQHLFMTERSRWDEPKKPEISYFDTDFGRFGLIVCFDAVFEHPAVDLVRVYNVTDMIFSTAWMNVFPHFVSIGYHSGWAKSLGVNYLMSNLRNPQFRLVGSGVFTPNGILSYTFNKERTTGKLLVAEVPTNKPSHSARVSESKTAIEFTGKYFDENNSSVFEAMVFGDTFVFKPLAADYGKLSVCTGKVCCFLDYNKTVDESFYALGAFDGMHYVEGTYYLEVCLLIKCRNGTRDGCGLEPEIHNATTIHYFNLTAAMQTDYAFPSVAYEEFRFSNFWTYEKSGRSHSVISTASQPIISVVLMGRNFNKDPGFGESNGSKGLIFHLMFIFPLSLTFWIL